jgi:hypothetical protein
MGVIVFVGAPALGRGVGGRSPLQQSSEASRNERLAAVDPEAAFEALRLLSERRLWTWVQSVPGRSTACTHSYETSSPAG